MAGWHHQLDGHESEQTLGNSEGQGILGCCSPWGHRESDTTEQQQFDWILFTFNVIETIILYASNSLNKFVLSSYTEGI